MKTLFENRINKRSDADAENTLMSRRTLCGHAAGLVLSVVFGTYSSASSDQRQHGDQDCSRQYHSEELRITGWEESE